VGKTYRKKDKEKNSFGRKETRKKDRARRKLAMAQGNYEEASANYVLK
jgi:hypothetical protein